MRVERLSFAQWAAAVLCNSLGRYEEALAAAQQASEDSPAVQFANWALVELIEAATRSGVPERAAGALQRLSRHRPRLRDRLGAWHRGPLASAGQRRRGRREPATARRSTASAALACGWNSAAPTCSTASGCAASGAYVTPAISSRRAYKLFDSASAPQAFAERARIELRATGAQALKRTTGTPDVLTAQEALIARLASQGTSNPQIAAQLFISPATVAYHLGKVFAKLGISSRSQLARALPIRPDAARAVISRRLSLPSTTRAW